MRVLLAYGLPLKGFSYVGVEELCSAVFDWDGQGWMLKEPAIKNPKRLPSGFPNE
jgi:hypothetical protein